VLPVLTGLMLLASYTPTMNAQSRWRPWRGPHVHRIAPAVEAWFQWPGFRLARGRFLPGGPAAARQMDRVHVTIRLEHSRALRRLVALEDTHLRLVRHHGRVARLDAIVCARLDATGLARLRHRDWVERVELDMRRWARPPLDLTVSEIHADAVWATLDGAGLPVTGQGVTIADLDAPVDVTHPLFFRADGGHFDWIDVDGNDAFDPGVDAADLNSDGRAGVDETIHFWDGVVYTRVGEAILGSDDGAFDLGWDHLYVDANENGLRDFGPAAGFGDGEPGMGEVLLLVDDVNGNGLLDPGEKLVALGSSKIRAVYDGMHEYLRGVDLSDVPPTAQSGHGTGVAGILVGGHRGLTRLVGVAPDADLLMIDYFTNFDGTYASLFTWAVDAGADVVLHEYAPSVGYHLDGSSNYEQMLDQAAAAGVAQVSPAGNLGGSDKHCLTTVAPQASRAIDVDLPADYVADRDPYTYLGASFLWRLPARNLTWTLEAPGGETVDLGIGGAYELLADGTTWVWAARDDSLRGTAMMQVMIFGDDGADATAIATGVWRITATDTDGATAMDPDVTLAGWVHDDVSGWRYGSLFLTDPSEAHLIGYPGTADSAITLAAYAAHDDPEFGPYEESRGELRRFSGRGKRIDGALILDIAAPDNPVSAHHRVDDGAGEWSHHGAYTVFGGTSGAGPHVAGTAALLKQLHPEWTGFDVRDAIRQSALMDGDVTADATHPVEELWGAGKLRTYEALYGQTPAPNSAPTITVPSVYAAVGERVLLHPVLADAEDAVEDLQVYWDDDYDGTWDLGPEAGTAPRGVTFDATGVVYLKVRVVDTGGLTAEALAEVTVVAGPLCDGTAEPPDVGGGDGCGCRSAPTGLPALLGLLWVGLLRRRP
jgi:MYXO-CTERM domain-containing protein